MARKRHFVKRFFKAGGPGFVTGAADDDPSGIATYSQTGALFGYAQLWLVPFTYPFMTAVQEMCGRIGLVTGTGLAGVLRRHYPRYVLWSAVTLLLDGRGPTLELRPAAGGWLKTWAPAKPGHRYVIGADCAGSDAGGDHNAACVLDRTAKPWEVVATIHGLRGAALYARALANVGYLYNEALIAVEVNGIGEACQSHLRHWYPERGIYHRLPIDRAKRRPGERIGWYTGHVTRQNLVEDLDSAIRDETIKVLDEETMLELLNFQRVPGMRNGEAKPGMHDDRVFALGIAIQAAGYRVSGEYDHFEEERHVKGAAPMAGAVA